MKPVIVCIEKKEHYYIEKFVKYHLKLGIKHVAKKDIPTEWLEECLKSGESPINTKRFFG